MFYVQYSPVCAFGVSIVLDSPHHFEFLNRLVSRSAPRMPMLQCFVRHRNWNNAHQYINDAVLCTVTVTYTLPSAMHGHLKRPLATRI